MGRTSMSVPELKHLRVTNVDSVAVVDFVGSELMYATELVLDVGAELKSLVKDRNYTKVLLNFRNVQYLSSTMLAQLASLDREIKKENGQLKICGLGPVLKDTFRIGHFEPLFAIYEDEGAALKGFH
jgi:anti-sigma B factor antagonist